MAFYNIRRLTLFAASALLSSISFDQALAQAATSAPAANNGGLVDEVVVSARRREERLQDVPMSVTSLSAETLAKRGVTDTLNLQQVTPGLRFATGGFFGQPIIRGVGTTSAQAGDESSVALYIDGVYVPGMNANLFKLNNVERIEVLRGPQGTLFGRNAAGGAISITSKAPSEDFHGNALLGYGRFDEVVAGLYVSGGWAPGIATDLAVSSVRDHGFVDDILVPDHQLGRTRELSIRSRTDGHFENWGFSVIAGYDDNNTNTSVSGQPLNGASRAYFLFPPGQAPIVNEPWKSSRTITPFVQTKRYYGSVKLTAEAGPLSFTSLTSAANNSTRAYTDTDGVGGRLSGSENISNFKNEVYSQEFQVAPVQAERLQWVAGLYYVVSNAGNQPVANVLSGVKTFSKIDTTAYAAFGEGTYDVTDRLSITAGLRYSYERKVAFGHVISAAGVDTQSLPSKKAHWDAFTPRVIVRYIIPEKVNIYGSYSRGFKSGTFNAGNLTGVPVDPEVLDAYEVGLKTLNSDRYRITFAAFHYNYTDIQVSVRQANLSTVVIQNAASAKLDGAEATFDARLSDDWTLSLNGAYLRGRYDSFPGAIVTVPLAVPNATAVNSQVAMDVSGNTLIRSPKWTAGASLQYNHNFNFGVLSATGNLYWVDKQYWDPSNRFVESSHTMINAQLSWSPPSERYRFTLWGSNLLNEAAATTISTSAAADFIVYDRPRSFGIRAELNF